MKKFLFFIIFISLIISSYISYERASFYKVFQLLSPVEIFIDSNKNLIFDEVHPFFISDVYYIDSSLDYSGDPILKNLTFEQKYFLEYNAKDYSSNILKNKFVKVKKHDFIINNKSYKDSLLSSGFFYNSSDESKNNLLHNLSSYNLSDYVLFNNKSKKYHKLGCENAHKTKNIKMLHISDLDKTSSKAQCCHIEKFNKTQTDYKNLLHSQSSINDVYSSGNLTIYFIDLNSTFIPDSKCSISACLALKNEINNAKTSIDFAVYGFNNEPEIYLALLNALKRGVKIRWISNYDINEIKYYPDIEKLKNVLTDYKTNKYENTSNHYSIMHNKFFIFDKKKVFTGTANITSTDLSGFNANYALLIDSEEAAAIFSAEFEQMYNGKFNINKSKHPLSSVTLNNNITCKILFSPQDLIIDNYILNMILKADKYIYIPAFFITNNKVKDALISAKQKGVDIKIINDATNARTKYTIHRQLRNAGIKVKTENYAGKMHMKSVIIDDKYSIIGSMNFTSSGNKRNDENVIIIDNEKIAKYMKSTFLYLWNKIPEKYENYDPPAESFESIGSCFDGIDNDFDNKIDAEDEGCFIKK